MSGFESNVERVLVPVDPQDFVGRVRSEHELRVSIAQLLEEHLAELKRINARLNDIAALVESAAAERCC